MRVDIPIGATIGQGRSLNANPGENLNCFIKQANDGRVILQGTPGLNKKFELPQAPIRGCYADSSTSYWAAGNKVYKVLSDFSFTEIGTILTTGGAVRFASSGVHLMLVDGFAGYYITLSTDVLTQIVDPDFPANPVDVGFIRSFFLVTVKDSQTFYISEKTTIATDWNGLDFATAEGSPDKTAAMEIYQEEAVFVGYRSVEVWGFTGNLNFPMQRNTGVVIDHGCVAPLSLVKVADSLIWLGGNNDGANIVYRMSGYNVEVISTDEITEQIAKLPITDDAYAMGYQQENHSFYILQFPSSNYTLVYDTTTGLWHRRGFNNASTGNIDFWRGSCMCFNNEWNLLGDIQNGKVYALDLDYYTDDGVEIVRQRETTATRSKFNNMFYKSIRFDIEAGVGNSLAPGVDPKINLQWSNDSGHTWSNWRTISIGKIGKYGVLPQINGLGMGRQRVWRIRVSDPVKFVLFGIVLEAEEGIA